MKVKQFYDEALAHGSYAILSGGEIALIDPGRDPQPYLEFAQEHSAKIVAVFETHPHADFISSHLEFYEKHGAKIYINPKVGVSYPHHALNDREEVKLGHVFIRALYTPGHAPDHNTYMLFDEEGNPHSVYSGDTLFVGDVGRPDLREGAGLIHTRREELAHQMYHTIHEVFEKMDDQVIVYPAHGAGSLCGKNMRPETYSTIGHEKQHNWAFQITDENKFVEILLNDQPFIPKYFPFDVEVNRNGAPPFEESIKGIPQQNMNELLEAGLPIVDARSRILFKKGHMKGAINIQEGEKFETWLGTIISPNKQFYLLVENEGQKERLIRRAAKIGYETHIKAIIIAPQYFQERSQILDVEHFSLHPETYTIIDVRAPFEAKEKKSFKQAINIPLAELRERVSEIPLDKSIVVHCMGGYRSAIGASILEGILLETKVYDLGDEVLNFMRH
ncbi:MBL fold metallo-hydrolase [Catalinimonas niigatensis]|uniref:MBL fold metallo-hydrolase n=1 Tax=Catalinimonas niigatensis TaxID=1397264 RepID=UPI002665DFED|nr:MBL fold metallo-hydrolase [Catalinimonas niigatensis]WPP49784.1 MBL fold metallo-hydrolase [Catalinimonas niigatensis]